MCGVNGTQGAAPGQMSPAALNAVQGAGAASRFWTGDPNRRIGIATGQYSLTRQPPVPTPGGQQVVTADPFIRIGSAPAALPSIVSPAAAAAPQPGDVPLPRPRPEPPASNNESWTPPNPDGIVDPRAVALAANPNAYAPGAPAAVPMGAPSGPMPVAPSPIGVPAVAGRASPAPVSVPLPVPRPAPPAAAPGLGQRVQLPDGRMGVLAAPGLAIADGDTSGRYVGIGGGVRNPLAALFGG